MSRTGTSDVIFGYNGKYGVITDQNGLIYMRARYYSPDMKRFINADIIPGSISNAITLNRYAYANGNPVSFTDPFGLSILLTVGLIICGAFIGGLVSGTASAIEQKKESGEIDIKEVMIDVAWGAVDGGISASPMGFGGKMICSAIITAGNSITDQYFDSELKEDFWEEDLDYENIIMSVAIDVGFSFMDIKAPNKTKELNDVVSSLEDQIAREKRRANEKVRNKRIAQAELSKNTAILKRVGSLGIEPFSPKQISQYFLDSVINQVFFDREDES